jgi:hypothetical protein
MKIDEKFSHAAASNLVAIGTSDRGLPIIAEISAVWWLFRWHFAGLTLM